MPISKYYGLYDGVAKEFVNIFMSTNDQTAERSLDYIVRGKDFDFITAKDLILQHVFDIDSSTGAILDNNVYTIVAVATAVERFKEEARNLAATVNLNPAGDLPKDKKKV